MRLLTLTVTLALGAGLSAHRLQAPATGRQIYQLRCAMCHGAGGRGDGAAGASMNPRPTNLTTRDQRTALSDSAVAAVIMSGRRTMPAFGRLLTKPQVDSLVAYLRTLAR